MADGTERNEDGPEPTFRHVDDPAMTWQQVKAVRTADGSTASVWEKWLAFSPDPQYLEPLCQVGPRGRHSPARAPEPPCPLRHRR